MRRQARDALVIQHGEAHKGRTNLALSFLVVTDVRVAVSCCLESNISFGLILIETWAEFHSPSNPKPWTLKDLPDMNQPIKNLIQSKEIRVQG